MTGDMSNYKRIIIKVGTKVLSREDGSLDVELLASIVGQIVALRARGIQVVLVTSGAVGAGRTLVSPPATTTEVVRKQIFAAIGQIKLMNIYAELFGAHQYLCAQVLATKEDFRDEVHYLNMKNCFEGLLLDNVVPIVNENDVVATSELMFTDNDELAGLVAQQLAADLMIILTSSEGVVDDQGATIARVDMADYDRVAGYITPTHSTGGRGGMTSKFAVARQLAEQGIGVRIVNGKRDNALLAVVDGESIGTEFVAAV